jgi:hypothetical protein
VEFLIQFLSGHVEANGKLHLKLQAEGVNPYEFKPDISYRLKGRQFAWIESTEFPGIFDGEYFLKRYTIKNLMAF